MSNRPPNDPQAIIFILSLAAFVIITLPFTLWNIINAIVQRL